MKLRPCIDIHNGKVKQIVGSTLTDHRDQAEENYVSSQDASYYARLYREDQLSGGHIILLNPETSPYYQDTKKQAMAALKEYPGGFQIGGGIHPENAEEYLEGGASHVIVTSFVFKNGQLDLNNLEKMKNTVGSERLVLDLSCRKRGDQYFIVTDRWQKFTELSLTEKLLDELSASCDEFLIHAVDVEGKASGIETTLAALLGNWKKKPVTYAGGVGNFSDLEQLKTIGQNRLDVTIGSALDLFGGPMSYKKVLELCKQG